MVVDEIKTPTRDAPPSKVTPIKQILKNALFSSGSWIITIFIAFITTPYVVRKLTLEGYGIYALLTGLVGYYGLLDLGLGQGVIKFVAEYKAKEDYEGISLSINAALWVQIIMGSIGSAILIVFAEPILRLLGVSTGYWLDAKVSLYASAIGFFLAMITGTLSSVLMGLQRYDITSKVGAASNFLLTVFILLALYLGAGIKEVIFLTVASTLVLFVVYFWIIRARLPQWRFSFGIDKLYFTMLFNFSSFIFIASVSSLFSNYIARFVVGFFVGPMAVTFYVVPWKLINAFGSLLRNAVGTLFPYASELGVQNDREKVQKTFVETSKILASFSIPVYLAILAFAKPLLAVWMGNDFAEKGWFVLSLLSLSVLLGSLTAVPNLVTMGLGYSRVVGFFSIITVVFYMVLLPTFTKLWGIEGTAWAMLGAAIPGITLVVYETEKIMALSIWYYLRNVVGFHFLPMVASLVFVILVQGIPAGSTVWMLAFGLLFLCAYFCLMVSTGWIPLKKFVGQLRTGG